MPNFIYVFSKDACNTLQANGYKLLKRDDMQSLYIFKNTPELRFDLQPGDFVYSDVLTFT